MKAVGFYKHLPIEDPQSLLDVEIPQPTPGDRDLLVRVKAIAVNPVDTKVRRPKDDSPVYAGPKILGWDAAGEVVACGPACTLFKVGDPVYYAGDLTRPGTNSEFHVVDERIAGKKPSKLSFEEGAAIPLTAITAWEALFDRLGVSPEPSANKERSILIIGGAGGVGSIAIQLAAQVAGLRVIATASRAESAQWVRKLGAHIVINHYEDMTAQLQSLNEAAPDYILCLNRTDGHFNAMAELIKPQGKICSIVETERPVDLGLLKNKSATFVWELMFTRSMFQTEDMIEQHRLLNRVSDLLDEGRLETTLATVLKPINADNLRKAHALLEEGRTIGKIVLSGF